MRTLESFFRERWCEKVGVPFEEKSVPTLDELKKSEWVPEFIKYMLNRMVMGFFRYGYIHTQPLDRYDFVAEIERRLNLYKKDGNLEHMVDIGNLAMIQFFKGIKFLGQRMLSVDDGTHNEKVN